MKGTCKTCLEMQKTLKDYCCPICSLGIKLSDDNVIVDPFTKTVHIDLSDPNHPFWTGKK